MAIFYSSCDDTLVSSDDMIFANNTIDVKDIYYSKWVGFHLKNIKSAGTLYVCIEENKDSGTARYVPKQGASAYFANKKGNNYKRSISRQGYVQLTESNADEWVLFRLEDFVIEKNYVDYDPPLTNLAIGRYIFGKFTTISTQIYIHIDNIMVCETFNELAAKICDACFCHLGPYKVKDAEAREKITALEDVVYKREQTIFHNTTDDVNQDIQYSIEYGARPLDGAIIDPDLLLNRRLAIVYLRDFGEVLCTVRHTTQYDDVHFRDFVMITGHGSDYWSKPTEPETAIVRIFYEYDSDLGGYRCITNESGFINPITDQVIRPEATIKKIDLIL